MENKEKENFENHENGGWKGKKGKCESCGKIPRRKSYERGEDRGCPKNTM